MRADHHHGIPRQAQRLEDRTDADRPPGIPTMPPRRPVAAPPGSLPCRHAARASPSGRADPCSPRPSIASPPNFVAPTSYVADDRDLTFTPAAATGSRALTAPVTVAKSREHEGPTNASAVGCADVSTRIGSPSGSPTLRFRVIEPNELREMVEGYRRATTTRRCRRAANSSARAKRNRAGVSLGRRQGIVPDPRDCQMNEQPEWFGHRRFAAWIFTEDIQPRTKVHIDNDR